MKLLLKLFFLFFLFFQVVFAQSDYSAGALKEINGTKLFVKTMGSGEPIVMVHGGPGFNHLYFLPQFKELAKHYKLIFYDQRASGMSSADVDTSSITMENFVKDLEGIRVLFGLKKMNLFGHSWGGLVAINYAIKYPENLKSLILSNPTPPSSKLRDGSSVILAGRATKEEAIERRKITSSKEFADKDPITMAKFYKILFSPSFYNKKYLDSLNIILPKDNKIKNKLLGFLYHDPALFKYDLTGELDTIKCPTLIISGDHDLMPQKSNQIIHKTIKNSQLVTLKNSGHFPFVENRKKYFKVLEGFLDQLNKKK